MIDVRGLMLVMSIVGTIVSYIGLLILIPTGLYYYLSEDIAAMKKEDE